MARKYSMILIIFMMSVTSGLAFAEEAKESGKIEPYVAAFTYAPPPEKAPNSQGVTVAVAKAAFFPSDVSNTSELWAYQLKVIGMSNPSTGDMMWFAFPQFYNLSAKLRRDVAEILFAKGFSVRGPYDSYEAIPPADKNAIDLYFIPKMALEFTLHSNKAKRGADTIDTDIEVGGMIKLEALNMRTRESLWTKTVPLEKITFTSRMPPEYLVMDRFNSIMNEVAKGIERQYRTLMSNVSNSIDPQELRALKKSGQGKTGY